MRLIKFMMVGGTGAVLALALMYLFTTIIGWHYWVSYPLTFCIVVCFNYILNSRWTFDGVKSRGLGMFFVGRLGTLAVNEGLLLLLVGVFHWYYMLAMFVAIFVSFTFNYSFSRRVVWAK